MTLTTATNAFLPAVKTATGTIVDDDDPLVGTGAASAGEGAGTLDFEVTLDASPAEAVTVITRWGAARRRRGRITRCRIRARRGR